MPKDPRQSAKLLFLKECFERRCAEDHSITLQDIKRYLERKHVYISKDETITEAIETLGMDGYGLRIEHPSHSKKYYYYPDEDTKLTPVEIQLLVDCVQSSKFLTEKDTERITDKLLLLCSEIEQDIIKDTTRYSRPTKNHNPDTLRNLEILRQAIEQDRQVRFVYGRYDADKHLEGKPEKRIVSPLQLIYSDDNYYLMAWNPSHENVITYRIDRIVGMAESLDDRREQTRRFSDSDKKYYTQQSFHMFGGNQVEVTMLCKNAAMNTVIDQFGYSVHTRKEDEETFSISPRLCASDQFFGWVLGMNGAVKITAPVEIVEKMKDFIEKSKQAYEEDGQA